MNDKKLDLSILLKDHKGETFYLLGIGDVMFKKIEYIKSLQVIYLDCIKPNQFRNSNFVDSSGALIGGDGTIMLYPSQTLFEKYPLNPIEAWEEWKNKKESNISIVSKCLSENLYYEFDTPEQVLQVASLINDTIKEFKNK